VGSGKGLLSVDELMSEQAALLGVTLAKLTTLVGLLTCVDALMGSEDILGSESLGAVGTGKGALPGVDALVVDQAALLGEPLGTLTTLVGLLTCVDALVGIEDILGSECLGAVGAGEGALPFYLCLKRKAELLARVESLPFVNSLVFDTRVQASPLLALTSPASPPTHT